MRIDTLRKKQDRTTKLPNNMAFMFLKMFSILFLLISASFFSSSFAAGRKSKFVNKLAKEVDANTEEMLGKPLNHEEVARIHERLLRSNTKDYGRYDPAPALVKPPFKLIPN
ncbi:hypothetical protein ACFX13_003000 [Malus domestica]|uniref:Uncharacterized protein n=1 Tax=Malus domestica TaxID=3750 RepID=A0A498J3B6_MALDO|nr:protein CASPARIAN STRIP INTEGRITY FACTOR 1-like [Malus domestica]XP_050105455.1 protein CASPARIAN STRIP INTEGRITY FACTOR 1-like [Malus sylvestris]RXH88343.1 hypothetical protein DVH24_042414 [Malus domestica]